MEQDEPVDEPSEDKGRTPIQRVSLVKGLPSAAKPLPVVDRVQHKRYGTQRQASSYASKK